MGQYGKLVGHVLRLAPGDWRYGDGSLLLRLRRVMEDQSRHYDDEVWVEGDELAEDGSHRAWRQALIRRSVLDAALGEAPPGT